MKRILLLLSFIFLTISCSPKDDGPNVHYENLPVVEVELPSAFILGETHPIKVWYYKPTTCHGFNGFYYEKDLNIRTIAVQSIVSESSSCQDLEEELVESTMYFYVTNNGSYILKFWQGTNIDGEDIFLEVEVPVVD